MLLKFISGWGKYVRFPVVLFLYTYNEPSCRTNINCSIRLTSTLLTNLIYCKRSILMDILYSVLKANTHLINDKYLIFHVIDRDTNELRRHCYGSLECCLPTDKTVTKETMSVSLESDELHSDTNKGSK
ncbi:late expression factor 10 [Erinnyis ello granulovirus]|uniref:Late expression factor 10 n=1 Tax=Erinnyis ello granulovirus TaxID=307444 RepID=A0A097DAU2_9BBAC|nr:late expression factor 10 [Erinnyis ello granulovirus]AIS92123.1 late expression factor 10 [Erinnyis ello granulovirus]ARX71464.1 late expression factor 10 [Erinnyis ello granulovirus]ARX71594.1 late expression factor 10 [Erinnyis ello granulovirus]ARX71724.1 late expression factor 10 [Erinnyis ello granulovirus]ARX71854.1 late expression factor 10 [Erinnyis ello granulovirus]